VETKEEWEEFRRSVDEYGSLLKHMDRTQLQDLKDMGYALLRAHELLEELKKYENIMPENMPGDRLLSLYYEISEKKEYVDASLEDTKYLIDKVKNMEIALTVEDDELLDAYIRFVETTCRLCEEQLRVMLIQRDIVALRLTEIRLYLI
jgi:hypothetical protein